MSPVIIYSWIIPIIIALVTALLIRKFFLFVTLVSSYSMYPVIKPKDRILTALIYSFHNIKRGDIVVLYSEELHEMIVKRVIGLPNDFIEIEDDGTVYINHEKLNEPYVKYLGRSDGSYRVPEKKYLLLGDNRAQSNDSRHWQEPFISEKNIKGKTIFCIFPFRWI